MSVTEYFTFILVSTNNAKITTILYKKVQLMLKQYRSCLGKVLCYSSRYNLR